MTQLQGKSYIATTVFLAFFEILTGQSAIHWETAVFNNDIWRYFVGLSEPQQGWQQPGFDDSTWQIGPGGFGFGDNDDSTVIAQCSSVYLRIRFIISDTSRINSAVLHIDYDDAFVAYLNGIEIARAGINGLNPPFNKTGDDHEAIMYRGGYPESFLIERPVLKSVARPGENVLALQVHNNSSSSTDLSSNAWLSFGITDNSVLFRPIPSWFTPPVIFTGSHLPVVVIKTQPGEVIRNEPKITADMKIIYRPGIINNITDSGNVYSGKVGIEIRGRYSASLPQKPYGFETRDETGNNLNVSLLGMPEENDWILIANYNDKTFLRNHLAFELFRRMGHYAPRTRFCEVIVNNNYQGIYLLCEKIKRDRNRVDISELKENENSCNDLTGGYIFKTDYYTASDSWLSNYSPLNKPGAKVYFVYYYPDPDKITQYQKKYLKDFVNTFESILYSDDYKDTRTGYRAYIDVNSFIDYFILSEVTRNVDAYKKSRYFYKDKDSKGGKIYSGPPWDYDWAWRDIKENCIHFNQTDGSGWAYKINECNPNPVPPSWEVRLMQDPDFIRMIHDKYYLLRKNILSMSQINMIIDSVATLLAEAQERHFQKWRILGINAGTPEYGEQPDTYEGEIIKFKSWISRRLAWLDANMPGKSIIASQGYEPICRIFPNPADNYLHVQADTLISTIEIFTFTGVPVKKSEGFNNYSATLNLEGLNEGIYYIRIRFRHGDIITRKLIKR
ncbi:MAG: CotH kinase family protein [Bacteroidales bacterium]